MSDLTYCCPFCESSLFNSVTGECLSCNRSAMRVQPLRDYLGRRKPCSIMVPAINKLPSWDQMSEDILLVRSADNKTQHWALRIRFEQPYHGTYRDCYIDAYDGEYVREA